MGRISLKEEVKSLKFSLKEWNVSVFGDVRLKKLEILERLKTLDKLEMEGDWSS